MLDNIGHSQNPAENQIQHLIKLYNQGRLGEVFEQTSTLTKQYPNSLVLWNLLGASAAQTGKLDEAIDAFKKAISIKPDYADAYNNLGNALKGQGKLEEAIEAYNKVLSIKPDTDAYYNMGNALKEQGKLEEAVEAYNKAISIKPDYAEAYYNMGISLQDQGKLDEAVSIYNKAISIRPDYALAYYNMGNVLHKQGKPDEAVEAYTKAISIKPDYADAYYNLGVSIQDQGKPDEALEAYKKVLSIKPDYADAYYNMGHVLKDQGKLAKAIEAYKNALYIKPDYVGAYNNMGVVLQEQGKLDDAIEAYTKALSIKPDYAEAYLNLGNALNEQGKPAEAIEALTKALSIKPDYAEAYYNMGISLQDQGKLEEAVSIYNKALSIKPELAEAHLNLSTIKKYTVNDAHFLQVQKYYYEEGLREDTRCNLSFALAKMHEDIGKLDEAFAHLSEGNELRKKSLKYSINQDQELFTKLRNTLPHLLDSSLERKEISIGPIPIFILGMPRSGTTLVEQILSSHSNVTGAGELAQLARYGSKLATEASPIENASILNFREKYLSELSKLSNGKSIVTDKMPHNFRFIPLICAAFPEAKIVHVQRNAAATCWSNYKQHFASKNLGYCHDLNDIVEYYNLYADIMKLWESHYSYQIYNLNYESLTTDPENQARKLIKYLGLRWQDACLSPHTNKRTIRTASQQQVRQKIYKGSSEAWRKYEPYLNGAFDSLPSF